MVVRWHIDCIRDCLVRVDWDGLQNRENVVRVGGWWFVGNQWQCHEFSVPALVALGSEPAQRTWHPLPVHPKKEEGKRYALSCGLCLSWEALPEV